MSRQPTIEAQQYRNSQSAPVGRASHSSRGALARQVSHSTPAVRTAQAERDHVQAVLNAIEERLIAREQDMGQYPATRLHDIDDEETDTPHFDRYRDIGGSSEVEDMTNFTTREFNELWLSIRDFIVVNYNVGRGRRSPISGKDAFFMTLATLKQGGTWQHLSEMFRLPSTSFMETVTKFIQLIAPKLYVDQVESRCDDTKMRAVATSGNAFSYFPCALYAVDVTFQQSWRPGGSIQENGKYYSGKHHLYGLKVEVSVDTRGFAINCSEYAKGATHDITMFKDNKSFHQAKMAKLPGEEVLHDDGPLKEKFPNEWAILADKGYQGLANYLRCIHPKKGRSLSRAEETSNDQISSDRVIVENYFGRLNVLWRITTDKYRWNESLYDDVFRLSVALTNFHVSISPLCEQNGEWYRQSQHKLIQLGLKIKEKRRLAQEKYRAKSADVARLKWGIWGRKRR